MERPTQRLGCIIMFKNESSCIKEMLDSTLGIVDYYAIQDNGSTDGSREIVEEFLKDKEGFVYETEWKGFGWNRNHVLQKFQESDHGCHWITKMDCDEKLHKTPEFDLSKLDRDCPAYQIQVKNPNILYTRLWLWSSKYFWQFNEKDTCHETISIGENSLDCYTTGGVVPGLYHTTTHLGESYSVPTKYVSDALILEERMIKENSFLEDHYHFWYIGKSYVDASTCITLTQSQKNSMMLRAIEYFQYYLDMCKQEGWDFIELIFWAKYYIGYCNFLLGDSLSGLQWVREASEGCPGRNEGWVQLAEMAMKVKNREYFNLARRNLVEEPNPAYSVFIYPNCYTNLGGQRVNQLTWKDKEYNLGLSQKESPTIIVLDNFYEDPHSVRKYALSLEYKEDIAYYKGMRSATRYHAPGIVDKLEQALGRKITNFYENGACGLFQVTTEKDPQVYHHDNQTWAGVLFLNENVPPTAGTRMMRSKVTGERISPSDMAYGNGEFYLKEQYFDTHDSVAAVFNRLVLFNAQHIHAAGEYFGNSLETGRLVQLFFFD